jgi:hypothetical protein
MFKCAECSKETSITRASYKRNVRKNGKYICHSCKVKLYIGPILEKRNKDPDHRSLNSKARKKWWNSDEGKKRKEEMRSVSYKERLAKQAKSAWEDDHYRFIRSKQSKEKCGDDVFIETIREKARCCWNNEQYRKRVLEGIEKARPFMSELSKRRWSDPRYRNKILAQISTRSVDLAYKTKMSMSTKRLWQNVEYRAKMLEQIRRQWADPDFYARFCEIMCSDEVRLRIADGIKSSLVMNQRVPSKPQQILYDILTELGIEYVPEHRIGFYRFDAFVPKYNSLIEVQGDYWHKLDKNRRNDQAKSRYVASYFPDLRIRYLWEHEFLCVNRVIGQLSYWFGKKQLEYSEFDFSEIVIKSLSRSDVELFMSKYHYLQGVGRNARIYGGIYKDVLIAVCCFAVLTRKQIADSLQMPSKRVRELSRLCIHPSYQKKNLASWFLAKCTKLFKQETDVDLLVAYADKTFGHGGVVYKAANWKLDKVVPPSYWYVDKDGYIMHKKTLWDHAKSLRMTEKQFAEQKGYMKVHGFEKYRYVLWY